MLDSPGVRLIAVERERQISEEGWSAEHDAEHTHGELAKAGGAYAVYLGVDFFGRVPDSHWPASWHPSWWKPTPDDPVRQLVKAGALIAAEIDRLLSRVATD